MRCWRKRATDTTFRHLFRTKPDLFSDRKRPFYQSAMAPSNVLYARERLREEDLIEQLPDNKWKVVDPLFAMWLRRL